MSNLKLKKLLKMQCILVPFLIICSLFKSEKASAVYDKNSCSVLGCNSCLIKINYIVIYFKFFEYEPKQGLQNSYFKDFEVKYSTNGGRDFTTLMSASTENQTSRTWAWIHLKDRKAGSKINIFMDGRTDHNVNLNWKQGTRPILEISTDTAMPTQAYLGINWFPPTEERYNITLIQIKGKWYNHKTKRTEDVLLDYDLTPSMAKLKSNYLNSYPKAVINIEARDNAVKAYKEANAIVVEGAINENIQVYTTTGALVKSEVANCDMLQIPVPANQLYIVNVGQGCYKVAL